MKLNFLNLSFALLLGCNHIIRDEKLVGDIYVVKNSDDNNFHLVIYEGSINSNVLEDYVMSVSGNDTLLVVKCKNENADLVFYKVSHDKGKIPIRSAAITSQEFIKLKEGIKTPYSFTDNSK